MLCAARLLPGNYLQTLLGSFLGNDHDGERESGTDFLVGSTVDVTGKLLFQGFADLEDTKSQFDEQDHVDLNAAVVEDSVVAGAEQKRRGHQQRALKKAKAPVAPKAGKRRTRHLKKAKAPAAPKAGKRRTRRLKKAKAPVGPKAGKRRTRLLKKAKAPVAPKAGKRRTRELTKAKLRIRTFTEY